MQAENPEIIELELKYCERCGGLWLRVRGRDDIYCSSCALQVAGLEDHPALKTRKPRWQPRHHRKPSRPAQAQEIPEQRGDAQ